MEWGKVIATSDKTSMGSTPIEIEVADMPAMPKAERNLAEGIKSLYQTCQMYDLNLVVGKTSLPAHKVVLASMSTACCEQVRKAPPAASPPVYSNQWKSETASGAEGDKLAANAPVSPSDDGVAKRDSSRPELVLEIGSPEAARALLDMVYGLGSEYNISSEEANKDVLRLAKQLDVPSLQELAMGYLARDVTTENALLRLQTCREFALDELYSAIEEEVIANRDALELVAGNTEVLKHPEILQGLLVRAARMHRPSTTPESQEAAPVTAAKRKREVEEPPKGKPEKAKAAKTRTGGA